MLGNTMSISMLTVPAMLDASTNGHQSLKIWEALFHRGKNSNPKFAVITCLSYALAAYERGTRAESWAGYAAAGALTIALVPWTLVFMMPTNNKMLSGAAADGKGAEKVSIATANNLLRTWGNLNLARGLWPLAGAAVGMWTLVG